MYTTRPEKSQPQISLFGIFTVVSFNLHKQICAWPDKQPDNQTAKQPTSQTAKHPKSQAKGNWLTDNGEPTKRAVSPIKVMKLFRRL